MSGVLQSNVATLATSQGSIPCAFNNPVTPGSAIVAILCLGGSRNISKILDSVNNTNFSNGIQNTLGARTNGILYLLSSLGGAMTVTATFSGNTATATLYIYEVAASAVDGVGSSGSNNTGAALNSGTLTTLNANDILFGVGFSGAASMLSGTSGWNVTINGATAAEYLVVSATGSYSATFTASGSNAWLADIFALKAASTGPVVPSLPAPPNYPQGNPFISTLRIALLDVWSRFPHRLISDNNGNFYTAKQLINNHNLGTKALMEVMVEYSPELGTITWVSRGIRQGILYQVQGFGVNAAGGVGI